MPQLLKREFAIAKKAGRVIFRMSHHTSLGRSGEPGMNGTALSHPTTHAFYLMYCEVEAENPNLTPETAQTWGRTLRDAVGHSLKLAYADVAEDFIAVDSVEDGESFDTGALSDLHLPTLKLMSDRQPVFDPERLVQVTGAALIMKASWVLVIWQNIMTSEYVTRLTNALDQSISEMDWSTDELTQAMLGSDWGFRADKEEEEE